MYNLDDYRTDKDFKLDSLSYEEMFDYFKDVVDEMRKKFHVKGFKFWPVELKKDKCSCKMAYGADKNLYPKVRIAMDSCDLILTPFEAKLLVVDEGVRTIMSPELNDALLNMMNEKFPESDYKEKSEKYFKDAELMRLQYTWDI